MLIVMRKLSYRFTHLAILTMYFDHYVGISTQFSVFTGSHLIAAGVHAASNNSKTALPSVQVMMCLAISLFSLVG